MKKTRMIYGILLGVLLLLYVLSPRFGWYIRDVYTDGRLFYAGVEKSQDSSEIVYRNSRSELRIRTAEGASGAQISYHNENEQSEDSWEVKESYREFLTTTDAMPFSIQVLGRRMLDQDKQEHGVVLAGLILVLGICGCLIGAQWRKACMLDQKMKRDICMILWVVVTVLLMGVCLRVWEIPWMYVSRGV